MDPPTSIAPRSAADELNHGCDCRTLDRDLLRRRLESDPVLSGLAQSIRQTRPHLFSDTVVFVSRPMADIIARTVETIEQVIALPAYQELALSRAPDIARCEFGPRGVFMGYDFHIGAQGPRLIEINTNAGGALLNAALARAQQACCEVMQWAYVPGHELPELEQEFCDMFFAEWRLQRSGAPTGELVIVDDGPADQYLGPEFELFRQMFRRHGLSARIADPRELEWREGRLWCRDDIVDMVYNRLTDFHLAEPGHQALRQAYESGVVVLTPHPRAHALHADKRNLITLSDDGLLAEWEVPATARDVLRAAVPRTCLVSADNADDLWRRRRQFFFKPFAGYGAKAAYRGDKLTRRVWGEILAGDFVAQELVPPGERLVAVDGVRTDQKFDVRAYTYAGRVQLLAARIYSGQTTNFRTPGGGFAPVVVAP